MSVINKITLFELFDKAHKTVSPLFVIEYDSGVIKSARDFISLPKRAKNIIKTSHYNTGYKHKFTSIDGTLNDLHITEYERF